MSNTNVDLSMPDNNPFALSALLRDPPAADEMAVALASHGLHVFPLTPGTKRPATVAGVHDATSEPASVEAAFAAVPGANIGLVPGTSLIIIDADTPEEVAGFRRWAADMTGDSDLLSEDCTPPTVMTPGTADGRHFGGGHWYCSVPPEMTGIAATLPGKTVLPGGAIAITGHGNYVVAPPSTRPEGAYEATGWILDAGPGLLAALKAMEDAKRATKEELARKRDQARNVDTSERDDAIDDWEDDTPWGDILAPAGWVEHGTDSCGCTTWTRPGASNLRSATAHECSTGTRLHVWSDAVDELEPGSHSKLQTYAALYFDGDVAAALDAIAADTGAEVLARPTSSLTVTDGVTIFPTMPVDNVSAAPRSGAVETGEVIRLPELGTTPPPVPALDPGVAAVLVAAGAKPTPKLQAEAATVLWMYGGDVAAACRAVEGGGGALLNSVVFDASRRRARAIVDNTEGSGLTVDLDTVGVAADDDEAFWAELSDSAPLPAAYGIVYRKGLHLLAGAPGCGKTWLSLAVLRSMADASMTYPSLTPAPGARRPVVYIDADGNGRAALLRRLMQIGAIPDDVRPGGGIRVVSLPDVAAEASCSMEDALRAVVAAAEKDNAKALVLDTMSRAIVAMGGDSNSSDSVTAVMNVLAPLAETACVVVLDHVGHENKGRPAGSVAKIGTPSVVLMMEKMRRNSDVYPDTIFAAAISVVKDRHGGIISHTCDPEDERRAGVWAMRETERVVKRLGVPQLDIDMIPARVSAEKRVAEAKAAEEAATPVAVIIAEAVNKAGGPLSRTEAVKAIRNGREGETRRGAEAALDAAVVAGVVTESVDEKQPNWRRYSRPAASH